MAVHLGKVEGRRRRFLGELPTKREKGTAILNGLEDVKDRSNTAECP